MRLLSLDVYRGFIMVLLALEGAGLYEFFIHHSEGTALHSLFIQFDHHPWHGLRFWDLIQPSFMFMAGVSLAYSLQSQKARGWTWSQSWIKTIKRCGWLFFWGVLDYAVRPGGLSFELWDVLTQLSFTTLVAFLVFEWKISYQLLVCAGLLLLTEILYRMTHVPGFDQPFTDQQNFGNYIDTILMNKINKGGWVAINCIPTAVHTVAGAIIGKIMIEKKFSALNTILIWAGISLFLGYVLDWTGITPIIKRIATTSFTLVSLGWALLFLAFFYWWVDIKNHKKYTLFFTVVGMNSLFIYLFFEIVGSRWFNGYITAIASGVAHWITHIEWISSLASTISIFGLEWWMCYFFYKKGIFFKI